MVRQRKSGGSKLSRSQTVTVRLDPKLRYLAELAARKQRRTLSSFIEWAIDNSLTSVLLVDHQVSNKERPLKEMAENLWDVDEAYRLVQLGLTCPELLDFHEQHQWKVICETPSFRRKDGKLEKQAIKPNRIKKHWEHIKKRAAGELGDKEFYDLVGGNPSRD